MGDGHACHLHSWLCVQHAPEGAHPSTVPVWRGMLLNQDLQKQLLQAGTSQTPFHKFLQVQCYRIRAVCVISPLSSVPVTACACFGAHSNQRQQSTALTHAKICTATSTLWGLSPGRHGQACRPENISQGCPKSKNPTGGSLGDVSLFIPQLLPKDYNIPGGPVSFQISHTLPSVG